LNELKGKRYSLSPILKTISRIKENKREIWISFNFKNFKAFFSYFPLFNPLFFKETR